MRLGNCKNSVSDFLLCIQNLIGSVNAIGVPISVREHLDIILEGLPQDFESTVNLMSGKFGSDSIEEVETLLLFHEACLYQFCKQMLFAATENLTVSLHGQLQHPCLRTPLLKLMLLKMPLLPLITRPTTLKVAVAAVA
ncbi:hypothetical protein A2U01_0011930, partial [Trifolium medium]|nr:hypothetical protein [Trifolium medium]